MLATIVKAVFGSSNDRYVKSLDKIVKQIAAFEPELEALSDEDLKAQTVKFRSLLEEGKSLEDILPEAFATVREASKRVFGMRHFDVQMIGGVVLHRGEIAEMRTGEGKTLVATLACYLNAIEGKGVHVVTVNDYLARRDADWMGQIYTFLGLTVGVIVPNLTEEERRLAYNSDITYATNNELGFDYLRDNMKHERGQMVHRPFTYAIVDEVDSILIDEARTPLIISGPTDDKSELYIQVDQIVKQMLPEDYEADEKTKNINFTEDGLEKVERLLEDAGLLVGSNLYDVENTQVVHHLDQALKANVMFKADIDYIVKDEKVVIIDEFTGRMMAGRRYSEGLHQALEAKEQVEIKPENQTLASITFQNYFRLYEKLAGMTGTASTEADEFMDIYRLDVLEIPTNVAVARMDEDDQVYRTAREKYTAIIETINEARGTGQPVLVGTTSIEKSEVLAAMLAAKNVPHNVLNARYHEQEATIIAQAGVAGGVTIATNMAGRGTDIKLGGNLDMRIATELAEVTDAAERSKRIEAIKTEIEVNKQKVLAAGGLFVIGTERHESRRIDNQLRGRSGRQGDPGRSLFYLSLDDDLMRIFGSERMDSMLQKLGLKEGEAIVHPWINKALEKAQQKVEARNFDIRKNLLKFDNVMNEQRKVIFEQRIGIMKGEDVAETIDDMRHHVIDDLITRHMPPNAYAEQWQTTALRDRLREVVAVDFPIEDWAKEEGIADEEIRDRVTRKADELYQAKREKYSGEIMSQVEKAVLLRTLDNLWRDHIVTIEHLRQVIHLRGYGQRDPLNEYKTEGFSLFEAMIAKLRENTTAQVMRIEIQTRPAGDMLPDEDDLPDMEVHHLDALTGEDDFGDALAVGVAPAAVAAVDPNDQKTWGKIARNDTCPCGSGKKYKHCHGTFA